MALEMGLVFLVNVVEHPPVGNDEVARALVGIPSDVNQRPEPAFILIRLPRFA
jgi:hypothetical protein